MSTVNESPITNIVRAVMKIIEPPAQPFDIDALVNSTLRTKEQKNRWVSKRYYPSSFPYMCDVKEAFKRLRDQWDAPPEREIDSIKSTEAGTVTHHWFQNELLGSWTDCLWGSWKCENCGHIYVNCRRPKICANYIVIPPRLGYTEVKRDCHVNGVSRFEYVEPRVIDEDYELSGRIDGIIELNNKWYVLELKSTKEVIIEPDKKSGYDMLPMSAHIEQASIYIGMVRDLYLKTGIWPLDPEKFGGALLVYISRETLKVRSFVIGIGANAYDRARRRIDNIRNLVDKREPLYGQKICKNRSSTAAKECPFKFDCFPKVKKVKK